MDIAGFAAVHRAELAEIVDLPHGTRSHDSFSRVFRLLDPEQLETPCAVSLGPCTTSAQLRGVVAIDGKRMRRAYGSGKATRGR